MYVDRVDAKILDIVQRHGRATLDDLSQATGLSPSGCSRRLRRMEKVGLIQRYVALVEPGALGFPLQAYTLMAVDREDPDTLERFEEAIRSEPHVIHATTVTGEADFLVRTVARNIADYREMLRRFTETFPTLRNVTTLFLLEEVKAGYAVPIGSHDGALEAPNPHPDR
ncbi:MAG TPA: Lrp/AsnC family transcriptional regulator [Microvirga sp.]|jgi:Lrp/AsnC family leucine-responsive transcriptional regulator|nr:Lrp/AsnC family transcriptional regulator [Microvirga sp.]